MASSILMVLLMLLAMALAAPIPDESGCNYECHDWPDGCTVQVVPYYRWVNRSYYSRGVKAAYIPRCKPCSEVCQEKDGFIGGENWKLFNWDN